MELNHQWKADAKVVPKHPLQLALQQYGKPWGPPSGSTLELIGSTLELPGSRLELLGSRLELLGGKVKITSIKF